MRFKRLTDLDLKGQRVFIRSDLNVPMDESGAITDDTRIRASVPAISHCLEQGAAVMVTSHLGRPEEGKLKPGDSLAPVARRLQELLGRPVRLQADWVDGGFALAAGDVVMLENCRGNRGEKKDDEALARTIDTGRATYWSRSRREYWAKGDTSGHVQWVKSVALDCDGDALLVRVDQVGAACHTGTRTCFDGRAFDVVAGSAS